MADMSRDERDEILALARKYDNAAALNRRILDDPDSVITVHFPLLKERIKGDAHANDLIARALRLLAGEKGEPVVVKALEWQEPLYKTNGCWIAKSPIGTYSVVNEGGWHASRDDTPRDFYFEWSGQDMSRDTLYTAQAAAQADFETRIRSAMVNPSARSYADGVEECVRLVAKRRDDYVEEHGNFDPETGATEFPGNGEEYVGELDVIEEELRALAPKEG